MPVLKFLFELVEDGNTVFAARSKRGYSPIHSAALAGSFEALSFLLERFSAFVNDQNEWQVCSVRTTDGLFHARIGDGVAPRSPIGLLKGL